MCGCTGGLDQTDHPCTMAAPRFETLEQGFVVWADVAGEGRGHQCRDPDVAQRYGISISKRGGSHEGGGERADAGNGRQPLMRIGGRK